MKILHFGIHNSENKNSGDTLLFKVTRDLFNQVIKDIDWSLRNIWEPVDSALVDEINQTYDAILIGGGGLFLRDQKGAEKSLSGWQWNCAPEVLYKLKVPIVIFGVGYNRFRGQEDFDPVFSDSLKMISKKCIFFGLRNTGSIEKTKRYVNSDVKFYLQHCPTTLLSKIYNIKEGEMRDNPQIVAFNLAYDRPHLRFGNKEKEILAGLGRFLESVVSAGFNLHVVLHKNIDEAIIPYLSPALNYSVKNLTEFNAEQIIDYYRTIDIAVGMRGHAQLIPFGLNKKILSVIAHDKLQFFLDDIQISTGVDVLDENFTQNLNVKFDEVAGNNEMVEILKDKQEIIWNSTLQNIKYIEKEIHEWEMIKKIDLIVYDFDGVLTDNRVLVSQDGTEFVFCNRSDGLAISHIKRAGIRQMIISTESNNVVRVRARKLNLEVLNNISDKKSTLTKISKAENISLDNVIFLGNDINDLEAMKACGWSVAPSDAANEVKEIADWITESPGGYGVVRELYTKLIAHNLV